MTTLNTTSGGSAPTPPPDNELVPDIHWPEGVWNDFVRHLTTANSLDQLSVVLELTTEAIFGWDAFFFSARQPGRDIFLRIQAIDTIHGSKVRLGPKKESMVMYSPDLQALFRQEGILINRKPGEEPKLTRFGDVSRPSMSLMYVPITGSMEVVGVLSLQSYTPNRYNLTNLQQLLDLAAMAAPALCRALAEHSLQNQEHRFRRLLDLTTDAIVLADAETGHILEANNPALELLGRSFASLAAARLFDIFPSEDRVRIKQFLDGLFSMEEGNLRGLCLERPDGSVTHMELTATLMEQDGQSIVLCRFRDVAQRFQTEEQRILLASFPELNPNPVVEAELDGDVVFTNPEADRLFPDLRQKGGLHPFMQNLALEADRHRAQGKTYFLRDVEVYDLWYEQMVHLTQPNRLRIYAFDITSRKMSEAKLRFDALHDTLTRLPNRALFLNRLTKALKRAEREPDIHLAVFFMDLDNFKVINDTLGHHMGDELLRKFAQRVLHYMRPGDTLSRIGGDEFTILLDPIASREAACQVADRILETAKRPFVLNDREFYVTTSIGVAYLHESPCEAEELLHDADVAMYHAKRLGKNQYVVFEEGLHAEVAQKKLLTSDVRRALNEEFFTLHYQPLMSLTDGHVTGWEALTRWCHPERGVVPPKDFVALADESGIGLDFAWWVMNQACRQSRVWEVKFHYPFSVNINVTARQIMQAGFLDKIGDVLEQTGLPPERLILDISETELMSDPQGIMEYLGRVKKLGVQLCLDDFGTGYSSMNYLTLAPLDCIKVDRSFVHRLTADPHSRRVVEIAALLARSLDCRLMAEGVEDEATREILLSLSCELGQGFLYAPPMDVMDADQFLSQKLKPGIQG